MSTASRAEFPGPPARRTTMARLLKAKTVSFFGGLCLLINAMTGPGVPYTPDIFQTSGWFFPTVIFLIFALVSSLSVLFIIEAMQAIPGNKHFQGTVEFATLINFYFGDYAHYIGQFMLYGAVQSNAIQSIIIMSQTFDNILVDIFGKSCALAIGGGRTGWYCVGQISDKYATPYEEITVLFTLGLLLVIIFSTPFGIVNLDDNVNAQIVAFILAVTIGLEWIGASFKEGVVGSRVPVTGTGYATVVGTIMLNLAFTTVVPSWVNIKQRTVSAQKTVWTSMLAAVIFYMLVGLIPALGFVIDDSGSILPALMRSGKFNKAFAYMFSIVMLLPSIAVSFIVAESNLVQNKIVGKKWGIFVCRIVPWLFCIPLQTGNHLQDFITWTSLIFVSTANFVIPLVIYLKCLRFRREYNESRMLSVKQKMLLKSIHWSSRTIHKFIDDKTRSESGLALMERAKRKMKRERSDLSQRGPIQDLEDDEEFPRMADVIPQDILPAVTINAPAPLDIPPVVTPTGMASLDLGLMPMPSPVSESATGSVSSVESPSKKKSVTLNLTPDTQGSGWPVSSLKRPKLEKKETSVRFGGEEVLHDGRRSPSPSRRHVEIVQQPSVQGSSPTSSSPSSAPKESYESMVDHTHPSTIEEEDESEPLYLKDDVPDPDLEHKLARMETRRNAEYNLDLEGGHGMRGTLRRALTGLQSLAMPSSASLPRAGHVGGHHNSHQISDSQERIQLDSMQDDGESERPQAERKATVSSVQTTPFDRAELIRRETLPVHPQYVSPTFRSIPTWFPIRGRIVAWLLLIATGGVSIGNIVVALVQIANGGDDDK